MKIFWTLLLILPLKALHAGEIKYPVSQIPAELLKGANVVCRIDMTQYQIISLTEAVLKKKIALTILNSKGDHYSTKAVHYSNLSKITGFEGALYNASGELVRKLKSKEIVDQSNISEISLMDDSRVKYHDFHHHTYPYTIEYETEEKLFNTYNVPDWYPQGRSNYSVQYSSFRFAAPANYQVRYKAFNYKGEPVEATEGKFKTYLWEVKNLPVLAEVFASPLGREITTNVSFAPSDFEMQGYRGNANTWEEFGRFQVKLHEGRDRLPESILQKVKELTAGVTDEKEKVKLLYEFLQKNTRYILVAFGIGSIQPFEASYVASKGYGDCKALSNYMYSLLKAAGIKSYYALINGGRERYYKFMMEDFPSHQFNHMVLSVPLSKDTLWLECTSQTDPFGYMGGFTGNRKSLLITEEGGKLVNTPRYGIKENTQVRKLDARMDGEGTLAMKVRTVYRAMEQDELSGMLRHATPDKVMKFLQNEYDLGTYTVNSYHHEIYNDLIPSIEEQLDITAINYATISGKRLFILPNILNRGGSRLTLDTSRKLDYVFDAEYRHEDVVTIEIPEGYQLESPFQDIEIKSKFGSYSASVKLEGNQLVYRRIDERIAGRFPPSAGEEVVKFFGEIFKADRARVVFVKKG